MALRLPSLSALLSLSILALAGCTIYEDDGSSDPWPPQAAPDAGFWPDASPWLPDARPPRPDARPSVPDASPGLPDADLGPVCWTITNEAVCVVTDGCRPLYEGVDCVCYGDGTCECDDWVFDRCE